jgi:hypothetical protein
MRSGALVLYDLPDLTHLPFLQQPPGSVIILGFQVSKLYRFYIEREKKVVSKVYCVSLGPSVIC